jgi:hypothetical protein
MPTAVWLPAATTTNPAAPSPARGLPCFTMYDMSSRSMEAQIVNRTQALVLGFFAVVWVSLAVILAAAPDVYDAALRLPADRMRQAEVSFLAGLSAFIVLLVVGVLRRWRWTFWLILVAFLFGVLRVPVAILQLTGVLRASTPSWYVALQGLIGLAQFAVVSAMVVGYRRSGVWGSF